jgi:hypothetical protein
MGARTKRIERIRKALPIVDELLELSGQMDECPWTRHDSNEEGLWLALPISMNNREDDARDVSNFRVAERELDAVAAFGTQYRHDAWPGGVILTLCVRADDALALREAQEIVGALSDYPILDDEDHSEREWEMNHPNDSECYAEDCSCDAAEKQREVEDHESGGHGYHFEGLCTFVTPVEYDGDGDWWCDTCSTWFTFDDTEKAAIARDIVVNAYRLAMREWEAAGQMTIPLSA